MCVTVSENEPFDDRKGAEVKCTLYILIWDAKATNVSVTAKKNYALFVWLITQQHAPTRRPFT